MIDAKETNTTKESTEDLKMVLPLSYGEDAMEKKAAVDKTHGTASAEGSFNYEPKVSKKPRIVIKNTAPLPGVDPSSCTCPPSQLSACNGCSAENRPEDCPGSESSNCPNNPNYKDDASAEESQTPHDCPCSNKQNEAPKELTKNYKRLVILAGFASVATAITLIVMKFVVWIFSGSSTILASLTDSLIDLGASFVNLLALRYALQPADDAHRFGHFKAEALASLTQAAFIGGSALLLIFNGYERLIKPVTIGYIDVAIYVSIASIVITLMLTFFQGYVCKLTQSEAVEADRFHYLSDVGLNLSVILSLFLTKLGYEWSDGLITILLGLYIMKSSYHIGKVAVGTLLDRSMSVDENNKIIKSILAVSGIDSFHDLRTRKAGPQHYIQCHIVIDHTMPLQQAHDLADEAEHNIRRFFPDADISLHMEPDKAETYKDISFIDSQFCQVPHDFYEQEDTKADDLANAQVAPTKQV